MVTPLARSRASMLALMLILSGISGASGGVAQIQTPTTTEAVAAPKVPVAPTLPREMALSGAIADTLLLGGAIEAVRERRQIQEAERYRARLAKFVAGLSEAQYAALMADDQQSRAMRDGLLYLTFMRERAAALSARHATARVTQGPSQTVSPDGGTVVYSPQECIGAIVMGVCHGSILPSGGPHPVCHGNMINGVCTGPIF